MTATVAYEDWSGVSHCTGCGARLLQHPPYREGSREHVTWWDSGDRRCMEKDCEENHRCTGAKGGTEMSEGAMVELRLVGGRAKLLVDGADITKYVKKATVTVVAGDRASLDLELEPMALLVETEDTRIRLHEVLGECSCHLSSTDAERCVTCGHRAGCYLAC